MNARFLIASIAGVATILAAVIPAVISALKPASTPSPASVSMQGNTNIYAPGGTVHATTNVFNSYVSAWVDGVKTLRGNATDESRSASETNASANPASGSGPLEPGRGAPPSLDARPTQSPQPETRRVSEPPGKASLSSAARTPSDNLVLPQRAVVAPDNSMPPQNSAVTAATGASAVSLEEPRCTDADLRIAIRQSSGLSERVRQALADKFEVTIDLCKSIRVVIRKIDRTAEPHGGYRLEGERPLDRVAAAQELERSKRDAEIKEALAAAIGQETNTVRVQLLEAAVLDNYGYYRARDLIVQEMLASK